MSFRDAIRSVLGQYATFSGRARRSEYWYWALAMFIAYVVANVLDTAMGSGQGVGRFGVVTALLALATVVPNIAVTVRRLHDTGRSGFWWFITFVPFVGVLILLVFTVLDSGPNNQYGPNPKGLPYQPGSPAVG